MIYQFDRYIDGVLMAEGVTIEQADNFNQAMKRAANLASKGPRNQCPVLVLKNTDEIERLRKQLEMSEQRFAALKEAYDKNRRRNIQLYGSNKINGAGIPWVPKKQDEPEALGEDE